MPATPFVVAVASAVAVEPVVVVVKDNFAAPLVSLIVEDFAASRVKPQNIMVACNADIGRLGLQIVFHI